MADSSVRQRQNKTSSSDSSSGKKAKSASGVEDTSRVISILDVLRVLVTMVVAAVAVSYYTTSGESLTYGYKPWFLNANKLQAWYNGPVQVTLEELARHDGRNPDLPLWIAVNGTVFDVSSGRRMYGPGGSYSVFAGRDATRAFVTGCFVEDRTHDLRGAERAFLPIEDVPNEPITKAEKKARAEREKQAAKQRVHDEIKRWADFFGGSDKYAEVGKIVGLRKPTGPSPSLCEYAQKGRPKRSAILAQQEQAAEAAAAAAAAEE